jgi:hypothetical protein
LLVDFTFCQAHFAPTVAGRPMTERRIFPRPLPALAANLEFRNKQHSGGQTKNLSGDAKEK